MSELKLHGKVKLINETQTFDSGFRKREFVITTEGEYPQDVKFECTQDKVELLDQINVGDELDVHFNIRGNEYNGRYFVNLQAWRLYNGNASNSTDAQIPQTEEDESDLPF
jgi:hypothetical protein